MTIGDLLHAIAEECGEGVTSETKIVVEDQGFWYFHLAGAEYDDEEDVLVLASVAMPSK